MISKIPSVALTIIIIIWLSYIGGLVQASADLSNNSFDADRFLWGTEIGNPSEQNNENAVSSALKTKYIKYRLQDISFTEDGKTFTPSGCLPSLNQCFAKIDLDSIAAVFKANGWSMIPMLSIEQSGAVFITSSVIDNYVNFVDWFVSRYKNEANIKYIELINNPDIRTWKGTKKQLLEANNKAYERIKNKFPDILVGSPGFEYWMDDREDNNMQFVLPLIEYFLEPANGAKFDFWAFHGYPTAVINGAFSFYPPTKTAISNKYAGIRGIIEIRKKLDANGWQDRPIVDIEHVNAIYKLTPNISSDQDRLESAYTIQELVLKKTLKYNNKFALYGIIPLKIRPRTSRTGETILGSLNSDSSFTKIVKSTALLWSKLNEYQYSSHISGEFDNENQVWVEKFASGNKELYIFFKPFKYKDGKAIALDNEILNYSLSLGKIPFKVTLTDISGNISNPAPDSIIILKASNEPQFLEAEF